jgi:hypothetical protein
MNDNGRYRQPRMSAISKLYASRLLCAKSSFLDTFSRVHQWGLSAAYTTPIRQCVYLATRTPGDSALLMAALAEATFNHGVVIGPIFPGSRWRG